MKVPFIKQRKKLLISAEKGEVMPNESLNDHNIHKWWLSAHRHFEEEGPHTSSIGETWEKPRDRNKNKGSHCVLVLRFLDFFLSATFWPCHAGNLLTVTTKKHHTGRWLSYCRTWAILLSQEKYPMSLPWQAPSHQRSQDLSSRTEN